MINPPIRPFLEKDRAPILEILRQTGMFTAAEIDVAQELIDTWLTDPLQKDYILYTAEDGEKPLGYVCYGPTPATDGTFDLYWIAVDPHYQGEGIGKALLQYTERMVLNAQGRMIIIETSSQEKYGPTRAFYEKNQYTIEARIKNFYREGDDRLIYVKRL